MSGTAVITETTPVQLPLRGAALRQILKSIDPPAPTESKVKEEQPTSRRMPVKKAGRPSNARKATPKPPKVVYRETPPSSPEPEEKVKKPRKTGGGKESNLADLLNKEVKQKRKYVRRTPKKKGSDEDTDEEEGGGNTKWYEGDVTQKDLDIEKLQFKEGTFFLGLYKIVHLISLDESKGATYVVFRRNYELILRVNFIQKDDMVQLNTELKFLEMMELNDAQHFFSTIFDLGFLNKHQADGLQYYAYIYRGGPTLERCHAMCDRVVTEGSMDRIAGQLVRILEQLCGHGYRILSFSLEDFTIDARSRAVYLSNHTDIVKVYDGDAIKGMEADSTDRRRISWEGCLDFAPIKWHEQGDAHVMSERDTVESLIYMLIYMYNGRLPWNHEEDKLALKRDNSVMSSEGALINRLPPSLKCVWAMVASSDASDVNFDLVHRIFTRYTDEGEDFMFDWESEGATEEQQKLINMHYAIDDMQKQMAVMQCIFDNEELLNLR